MLDDVKVEKLVDDLTRPLFVFRMARGLLQERTRNEAMQKGARKRLSNSVEEIDKIVREYANGVR